MNELIPITDGSLIPVPAGYHMAGTAPVSNLWILNFLAGASEDRATPPRFDPDEVDILRDWHRGEFVLPQVII